MQDLTELKIFLIALFRPIIYEAIRDYLTAIKYRPQTSSDVSDIKPYGDFKWLCLICVGIPKSTLRIKSSKGQIPGIVKFGKRILYDKEAVLDWLKNQTVKSIDTSEIERVAEEGFNKRYIKNGGEK